MANFPDDELPSMFDVVVDGTGLVQSILAAALSQAGKSVLHLDRNGYYGDHWASLMHRELQSWMNDGLSSFNQVTIPSDAVSLTSTLVNPVSNLTEVIPIAQEPADCSNQLSKLTSDQNQQSEVAGDQGRSSEVACDQDRSSEVAGDQDQPFEVAGDSDPPSKVTSDQGQPSEVTVSEKHQPSEVANDQNRPKHAPKGNDQPLDWNTLKPQWRRFSFDLLPKVLYCRGSLVELLTQSNCGRYVEFKAVPKIYRVYEEHVEQVPCSRADLFSSQSVSMLEKRRMMKFLSFCADYSSQPELFKDYADSSFEDFLKSRDLPDKIIDYIAHSIAMVGKSAPTLEGLEATKIFLTSLGRFGNAPFLYPVFGVGELGQAFCRLCAVYGGVYCLRRCVSGLLVEENTVKGVVCSTGQRIQTSAVVCSARHVKDCLNISESLCEETISRAMIVTTAPIPGTDGKVAVVTVPPLATGQSYPVSILQLDPFSNCSAPGTYLLHLSCPSTGLTAQCDLEPVLGTLLDGPRVLWSLFFNMSLCRVTSPISPSFKGVYVTSDPDSTLNYEVAVKQARQLFDELCPNEEFLPTPPDPRDVVYDEPVQEGSEDSGTHESTNNAHTGDSTSANDCSTLDNKGTTEDFSSLGNPIEGASTEDSGTAR